MHTYIHTQSETALLSLSLYNSNLVLEAHKQGV